jgi:hypothetical protein
LNGYRSSDQCDNNSGSKTGAEDREELICSQPFVSAS